MITPEEFPYITALHVNSCYASGNFDIKLHGYKPFGHLILTGKNGSGKTTILNAIHNHLRVLLDLDPDIKGDPAFIASINHHNTKGAYIEAERTGWKNMDKLEKLGKEYEKLRHVSLFEGWNLSSTYARRFQDLNNKHVVFSSFKARRRTNPSDVETATKEDDFHIALEKPESSDFLNKNFKQYLVNKRINQAFDRLDNQEEAIKRTEDFFEKLTDTLRTIFDDEKLVLRFVRESFDTPIVLSDGREIMLKYLPDGFSGLLNIILDLFIRVDLVRNKAENKSYDPCGIVLIDEPEIHLHLELQEQVLPLLIELFPNIQFIVATHSPAVIASIKNATIFDLTTKETRVSEETVGRSYAELTTSHFGLENDYSTIADEYTRQIDTLLDSYGNKPIELIQQLEAWQRENAQFLSPTLQIKLEYIIAQQNAKLAVSQ